LAELAKSADPPSSADVFSRFRRVTQNVGSPTFSRDGMGATSGDMSVFMSRSSFMAGFLLQR
jgi:hypothetical protein